MKILHTSDWHIGHALYGRKRTAEHEKFLSWLIETIRERNIDALLVAGDVFDNGAPGGASEQLYYNFLTSILKTQCHSVVIVSGNHDSPTRLQAPSGILRSLDIHVIGLPGEPDEHVIELKDESGNTAAICCAVSYLRKNEIVRLSADDTSSSDDAVAAATRQFYKDVTDAALKRQAGVPIVAMGHLFAAGSVTHEGDGVRELYVGSLGHVGADTFPSELDYTALGHIHSEQAVAGRQNVRYCGSPLCMSFSEIGNPKYVLEYDVQAKDMERIEVPVFQQLYAVSGEYYEIIGQLGQIEAGSWVEVTYTGKEHRSSLAFDVNEAVKGTGVEVLSIRSRAAVSSILSAQAETQTLESMRVQDVFLRCLDDNEVHGQRRDEMIRCFDEIVRDVEESDLCE